MTENEITCAFAIDIAGTGAEFGGISIAPFRRPKIGELLEGQLRVYGPMTESNYSSGLTLQWLLYLERVRCAWRQLPKDTRHALCAKYEARRTKKFPLREAG